MAREAFSDIQAADHLKVVGPTLPDRSIASLLDMVAGFMGLQFAWSIMMVQLSPLLESLGADKAVMGMIWCLSPLAGVLVQPIAGQFSDRCRSPFGRRKPFLFAGTLLMAVAVLLLPHANALWMAAALLFLLEGGSNVINSAFRPLIPDTTPRHQHQLAFSMWSLSLSVGAVLAFGLGFFVTDRVLLFSLGAGGLFVAMLRSILAVREPVCLLEAPPGTSLKEMFLTPFRTLGEFDSEARKLCAVQFTSWFGLFCMWIYLSLYVTHFAFNAHVPGEPAYKQGVQWAFLSYFVMNLVMACASPFMNRICARFGKKRVHSIGLTLFACGFFLSLLFPTPAGVMVASAVMGLGWTTLISIPMAMFSAHLKPGREGVMLAAFNLFMAGPGIPCSLLVGQLVAACGGNVAVGMGVGGVSMLLAMMILQTVKEDRADNVIHLTSIQEELLEEVTEGA